MHLESLAPGAAALRLPFHDPFQPPFGRGDEALVEASPDPPEARKSRPAEPVDARPLPRRLGRYTLFDHIGHGGMADIFLAQERTELGGARLVVIKEVLPALAGAAGFAEMLIAEAKLASRLSHANVVKVEDLGREGGALYIAMEYVEGLDLREMLRRAARRKVPVPIEFSLRVVIEALKGLSYAHRKRGDQGEALGIVHRDVSPSNLLLSFEGEVKVCDFGIARANPLAEEISEEAIMGKAGYMSPEQARGDGLDARADVFAAGIILWELLAGRKLYKAKDGERLLDLARRAEVPELALRGLPHEDELHAIVRRALAPRREDRYPSAGAMLADLEDWAARARMVPSQLRFGEWLREHFGSEVLARRRARELVLAALARGPAVVIEPIGFVKRPEPAAPAPGSLLPDYEMTPSTFLVAPRADVLDSDDAAGAEAIGALIDAELVAREAEIEAASPAPEIAITPAEAPTPRPARAITPRPDALPAKLPPLALALAALALAMLWFLATR